MDLNRDDAGEMTITASPSGGSSVVRELSDA
jgi:hypothetical protein